MDILSLIPTEKIIESDRRQKITTMIQTYS